ncbi:hypothetical protein SteCoe_32425 [Stentor coeruleus]|uniref:Uncharacterized protein n=1 Tax=Stentor coeruleus TaxID=5963 RepID=A0A1R2AZF5_9CILI|nr:hypothetical protein SteCoe_32425 [Stentor coeruleus]
MEEFETISAASSFDEKYHQQGPQIRSSTQSSISSSKFTTPNLTPKDSCIKNTFMSPIKDVLLKKTTEENLGNTKRAIGKISNFHQVYLDQGLWPEISPEGQPVFKSKYQALKIQLHSKSSKVQKLKTELANTKKPCENCKILEKKHEKTEIALKQAVELSNFLLNEIRKPGVTNYLA